MTHKTITILFAVIILATLMLICIERMRVDELEIDILALKEAFKSEIVSFAQELAKHQVNMDCATYLSQGILAIKSGETWTDGPPTATSARMFGYPVSDFGCIELVFIVAGQEVKVESVFIESYNKYLEQHPRPNNNPPFDGAGMRTP